MSIQEEIHNALNDIQKKVADNTELSETVKIALRNVGHQLLLGNQDSTSLVLPVVALEKSKYKLSFQNQLASLSAVSQQQ